ncbi:MAG: phosphotriesterase family protein [Flavitalea sp.]
MRKVLIISCFIALSNSLFAQYIMTVRGKVDISELKTALPHEHVMTNFIGAVQEKIPQEVNKGSLNKILPHYQHLKNAGINFIFECTPAFLGRDVKFLKELSIATGINFVTNTGFYAAVDKKYLPEIFYKSDVNAIAKIWTDEFRNGIEGTGIRPGFIKVGFGKGPIDSIEQKLLHAAILTSRNTGLVIAAHTGDYASSLSQYNLLMNEKLDPSKLIWIHSQNASNDERKSMAEKGVWISMDNVSENQVEEYAENILFMKKNNLLNRLLISHDDGWSVLSNGSYENIEPFQNGNSKLYSTIPQKLVSLLIQKGMSKKEIEQLMKINPQVCFGIK